MELASSHLVCSVALTGVLILQAARWWAEEKDVDEDDEEEVVAQPRDEKVPVPDAKPVATNEKKTS